MKKYYIGLSITYHDPAMAIIDEDGKVLFAEATERYLQNKRALNCEPDQLFMLAGLLKRYCPEPGAFAIALNWRKKRPIYESIVSKLGLLTAEGLLKTGIKRLRSPLENYKIHHMMACQHSSIETAGINLVRLIRENYPDCSISFQDYDHHLAHAATACYSSPLEHAACAVIDSFGEHGSMAFYRYRKGQLERLHETRGLGSLGLYYMKITELCGFDWLQGEEWKVMGLAPYGKLNQELYDLLSETVTVKGFDITHNRKHIFHHLDRLSAFKRTPNESPEQSADLAYTGQYFFSELMTCLLQHLYQTTDSDNLVLGGGCALNSAFNGQITSRTGFKSVHIPSAPADDGTALGAAWLLFHRDNSQNHDTHEPLSPYLGSTISGDAIQRLLSFNRTLKIEHLPGSISKATAELLAKGKLVGWIQGRAEFGPRALGNRSILADPGSADTQDKINKRIKFRETFRPFAPSILHEFGADYFENYQESPYMDKTLKIRPSMQKHLAAVCHIDGTGRVQTVKQEWNPRFYQLLQSFYKRTNIPALLNTSFNVMGKPMVHSLEDTVAVFLTTGLDVLVIDDYLITKLNDE